MDKLSQVQSFNDLSGLDKLRQAALSKNGSKDEALEAAAKQFESIFTSMLLKSMRKAEDVLASDSPFNSSTTRFYRDMHDQQLAINLSETGSLGLADLIVQQLGGKSDKFTPANLLKAGRFVPESDRKDAVEKLDESKDLDTAKSVMESEVFESPKQFLETMLPYAQQAANVIGITPFGLLAQAALETG